LLGLRLIAKDVADCRFFWLIANFWLNATRLIAGLWLIASLRLIAGHSADCLMVG
jgi:hypothetical protein